MNSDYVIQVPQDSSYAVNCQGVGVHLQESMQKYGDQVALIDAETGKTRTYSELLLRSIRVAQEMTAQGVTSQDIISICASNSLDSNLPMYASLFLGVRVATLDPTLSLSDVKYLLNLTRPRMIFCGEESTNLMETAAQEIDLTTDIVVFGNTNCHIPFSKFLVSSGTEHTFKARPTKNLRETVIILFSSGTTGLAKGIKMHHYGLMVQQHNLLRNKDISVLLSFTSLYWISAIMCFFMASLNGHARVMVKGFNEKTVLNTIEKYKVTCCFMAPTNTYQLTKNPMIMKYDTSHLQSIVIVGGYFGKHQQTLLKKCFPNTLVLVTYGMTETHGLICVFDSINDRNILEEGNKLGSCGHPVPGLTYKIVDVETGKSLGPNNKGEIRLKGLGITDGYHNNPKDTSTMFDSDGYFQTGDIGYYDTDRCFYVVDRIKEMMKFQSWHILPAELEAILLTHPDVKEAAIIGIPHEEDGEHPMGVVVLKPGIQVSENDIANYFNDKVSDRKKLRAGVRIVDSIPRTPSGKLRKRDLRKMIISHE